MENRTKPKYYILPNGVECFDVVRYFSYNKGTAMAYIFRSGKKEEEGMSLVDKEIEDLKKAVIHLQDEIKNLEMQRTAPLPFNHSESCGRELS